MTWPDGIAAAIGILTAYLITHHQYRSTTPPQHPRRTENGHGRTDRTENHPGTTRHGKEGRREEDHHGEEDRQPSPS